MGWQIVELADSGMAESREVKKTALSGRRVLFSNLLD
jgi:hypothetical protein